MDEDDCSWYEEEIETDMPEDDSEGEKDIVRAVNCGRRERGRSSSMQDGRRRRERGFAIILIRNFYYN